MRSFVQAAGTKEKAGHGPAFPEIATASSVCPPSAGHLREDFFFAAAFFFGAAAFL
jgi:hypothetical protein